MDQYPIATNYWQILIMMLSLFLGITFAILQYKVFKIGRFLSLFYFLWHTIFCIVYYVFSLHSNADSTEYYAQSLEIERSFNLGTISIYYLTSIFSKTFGLSYFGVFLIYNLFGFLGMLALASALRQITFGKSRLVRFTAGVLPLTPGLSFWSAMIGKDALTFMGAGLICWAILNLRKRKFAALLGFMGFVLARPHIAIILLLSAVSAVLIGARVSITKKALMALTAIPICLVAIDFSLKFAGLGSLSSVSTSDIFAYLSDRQEQNQGGGSSFDLAGMGLPMRVFSYLFLPLYSNDMGLLGFASSLENASILLLFAAGIPSILRWKSTIVGFPLAFSLIFSGSCLLFLSNITANQGIAVRQKWMILPFLFIIVFSYFRKGRVLPLRPRLRTH